MTATLTHRPTKKNLLAARKKVTSKSSKANKKSPSKPINYSIKEIKTWVKNAGGTFGARADIIGIKKKKAQPEIDPALWAQFAKLSGATPVEF